jgi:hypothetical protein
VPSRISTPSWNSPPRPAGASTIRLVMASGGMVTAAPYFRNPRRRRRLPAGQESRRTAGSQSS